MSPDALVLGYSCTKAVAATIAHIMVTEGYLTYDEPVCERVWRAFCPSESPPLDLHVALDLAEADVKDRWAWKRQITLRHILTHSSGLWSALPAKLTIKSMASCEQCVASFEYNNAAPEDTILPGSAPGSKTEYHFLSFGWLVAGAVTGAYGLRHGLHPSTVTFKQVYEAILLPRLSKETLKNGFRPCGGGGDFPMAFTETDDISVSKILQTGREAEAIGEEKDDGANDFMQSIRESFHGKEFLLDPRIWNCEQGLNVNCPAAGGRFSASGLAMFYHDLGSGKLLNKVTLESVSAVVAIETLANSLQGQTVMTSSNNADSNDGRSLGFGYQLIQFENDNAAVPSAFGHAGVGGSIGFHHSDSGISVGVMLNKVDADKGTSTRIVQTIAKHFGW
jgi:CubicO group peptidase (beta-lactamase class C family)